MMRLVLAAVLLAAMACGGTEAEAAGAAPLAVDTSAFVGRWNSTRITFADGTVWPLPSRTDIAASGGTLHISDVCTPSDAPYSAGRGPSATATSASTFDVQPFACPVFRSADCSVTLLSWFGLVNNRITTVTGGHGSLSADGGLTVVLTGTRAACGDAVPFTMTFVATRG